jgi:5'-nucleotidase
MSGSHPTGADVATTRRTVLVCVLSALSTTVVLAGAPPSGAAAKRRVAPITVLVTNDDGVGAPGIGALAQAVRVLPNTDVVVVAPATNQSGAGGKRTDGVVHATAARTTGGLPATAVEGTPADSVDYALDVLKVHPTVTLSGANIGQNLGPFVDLSGTVGAARRSAAEGVPALAVSAQTGDPDYALAGRLAAAWVTKHRRALATAARAKRRAALDDITNLNVPTCPNSRIRGLYQTTPAPPGTPDALSSTIACDSTATTYPNDVAAFNDGWATQTPVPVTPSS